jgi:hypothetical protein
VRGLGGLAAALALTASAAGAQQAGYSSHLVNDTTLVLVAGERATVRLESDGRLTLLSVFHALPAEATPGQARGEARELVTAPPGTVAFVLGNLAAGGNLKVENATSRAFDYRAAFLDGPDWPAKALPISVCTVLPRVASFEGWERRNPPALLVGALRPRDSNQVICPAPADSSGDGPPSGLKPADD